MNRPVLVAGTALLLVAARAGGAQQVAALAVASPAAARYAPTVAPEHRPGAFALAPLMESPLHLASDSAGHRLPARQIVLAARVAAAGVTAVLLSVDNSSQWRQCEPHYPEPYPAVDRALSRPFYDGLCLRRWEHHVARVFLASTANDVAHDALGMRRTPAALLTALAVGAAPHAISRLSKNAYSRPTAGDAAADVWFASLPLTLTLPKRAGGRWAGFALWAGRYALLYPFARP